MGLQYTRSGGKGVDGTPYRQMAREIQSIYEEELATVGEEALFEMRTVFRSKARPGPWSGSFSDYGQMGPGGGRRDAPNPAGRINTGEMLEDLDVRITRGKTIGLDVGWIHNWEPYYIAQDQGFRAGGYRVARDVKGMHVIAHMSEWLRGKVDQALDRAGRRVVDGL